MTEQKKRPGRKPAGRNRVTTTISLTPHMMTLLTAAAPESRSALVEEALALHPKIQKQILEETKQRMGGTMLKIVLNAFGVPHYDSSRGRYLMEDKDGKRYWLDDQVFAENLSATVKAYINEGYDEPEAKIKADERAFEDWDVGFDGVEEAE